MSSSARKVANNSSVPNGSHASTITWAAQCAGWAESLRPLVVSPIMFTCFIGLKATHCLADVMRELKKASSIWVHDEIGDQAFNWQEGYAAFTVSATAQPSVRSYIDNQPEHHRQKTFRAELLELLQRAEVTFDPQYFD